MPTERIDAFTGRYRFLSNFSPDRSFYDRQAYPTAEHAFAAAKFTDLDYRRKIATAPSPGEAKRLGRTRSLPIRAGWDEGLSYVAMTEVVSTKFGSNPRLRDALLDTDDAVLVEGNTHHDNRWGDCVCGRTACAVVGTNHLGLVLMGVRAGLREA